jgi:hypothetical protein
MILPLRVLGKEGTKFDLGRHGDRADFVAHMLLELFDQSASLPVTPSVENAVGVDHVALQFVGHADTPRPRPPRWLTSALSISAVPRR